VSVWAIDAVVGVLERQQAGSRDLARQRLPMLDRKERVGDRSDRKAERDTSC
jgi:hypothetical protein